MKNAHSGVHTRCHNDLPSPVVAKGFPGTFCASSQRFGRSIISCPNRQFRPPLGISPQHSSVSTPNRLMNLEPDECPGSNANAALGDGGRP